MRDAARDGSGCPYPAVAMSPDSPAYAITGFRPEDEGTPAPEAMADARAEFAAVLAAEQGKTVKDPRHVLTAEERRRQREELEGFVKAQREGEELSGFVPLK